MRRHSSEVILPRYEGLNQVLVDDLDQAESACYSYIMDSDKDDPEGVMTDRVEQLFSKLKEDLKELFKEEQNNGARFDFNEDLDNNDEKIYKLYLIHDDDCEHEISAGDVREAFEIYNLTKLDFNDFMEYTYYAFAGLPSNVDKFVKDLDRNKIAYELNEVSRDDLDL